MPATVCCSSIRASRALIGGIAAKIKDSVRAVVVMTDAAGMPALDLPRGMRLLCYDDLMAAADDDYAWPEFDENTASALCYTSGTTGRPKGVLYSHRSTVIHAYAIALPDVLDLRATSRILPVVPMFHVNAWGIPYATALTGAALVLPGRHLDGASLARLFNQERVTMSCGVPTVWLGLLQHLRSSGEKLATVKRIMTGGSAAPPLLIEAFRDEFGVAVEHGWGMTELSPVGTYNAPKPAQVGLSGEPAVRHMLKQGRVLPGHRHEDRRWRRPRTAVGRQAVRRPDGARTLGMQRLFRRSAGQRLRRRRLVRHRRRRDHRSRRLHGDHRPVEGRDQVRRRMDQLDHAGEHRGLAPRRGRGGGGGGDRIRNGTSGRCCWWCRGPAHTVDPESVLQMYQGQVAKWWLPDAVVVVDELPHTATGKLLKTDLRTRYRDYYQSATLHNKTV